MELLKSNDFIRESVPRWTGMNFWRMSVELYLAENAGIYFENGSLLSFILIISGKADNKALLHCC